MTDVWVKAQLIDGGPTGPIEISLPAVGNGRRCVWVDADDVCPRAEGAKPTGGVGRLRAACDALVKGASQSFTLDEPEAGWFVSAAEMTALRSALVATEAERFYPDGTPVSQAAPVVGLKAGDVVTLTATIVGANTENTGPGALVRFKGSENNTTIWRDDLRYATAATEAAPVEGPVRVDDRVRLEGKVTGREGGYFDVKFTHSGGFSFLPSDLTIVSRPTPKAPAHKRCEWCRWFNPDEGMNKCRMGILYREADPPACSRYFELYPPQS